jgi:hypothetical protein
MNISSLRDLDILRDRFAINILSLTGQNHILGLATHLNRYCANIFIIRNETVESFPGIWEKIGVYFFSTVIRN